MSYTDRKINPNLLVNGNFDIWQRTESVAGPTNGAYAADRFQWTFLGANAVTMASSTDVPTLAESGVLSQKSLHINVTTADTSIIASDIATVRYKMEGYDFAPLAQKPWTLSFWVKATKTGTYSIGARNNGIDRGFATEYTIDTTDTWEKKTVLMAASPSAGSWDYENGVGLYLEWVLMAGTDHHVTAVDTWESANVTASGNQVNGVDSTDNQFRLAQVKVEEGYDATPFTLAGENVGAELALCQRYLYNVVLGANDSVAVGQCISTTSCRGIIVPFPVAMRVAPTMTISAAGDFALNQANNTAEAVTALTMANSSQTYAQLNATVAANMVAGDASRLNDDGGANATMWFAAE